MASISDTPLDRESDLVTPLLTPLTYEGLVDELMGINNGYVKLPPSVIGDDSKEAEGKDSGTAESKAAADDRPIPVPLNSNDKLYAEIRDLNIEALGPYLQDKAKDIRESMLKFRSNKDASITEIHDFVKRIPGLQEGYRSLNQHIKGSLRGVVPSSALRQRHASSKCKQARASKCLNEKYH